MKKLILGLLVVLTMIMFVGCSTIADGTRQQIPINSQPQGADLIITKPVKLYNIHGQYNRTVEDTVIIAKTPYIFNAKRKEDYSIFLRKLNYEQYSLKTSKRVNPAIFGNILLGGVIGMGMDMSNGSGSIIMPERVDVILLLKKEDNEIKDKP